MKELKLEQEYQNENFIKNILVEPTSDDDGLTKNNEAPKLVSNKDTTEMQTVTYERKKRKRTSIMWNDFIEIKRDCAKQLQRKWCKTVFKAS